RGVGRRGCRAGGHRRDQQAPPRRAGRLLAMLPAAPHDTDEVTCLREIDTLCSGRDGHAGQDLRGGPQPHRRDIVDLVQVVEFGSQQYLRFVIERGVIAEVQIAEVTGVFAEIQVIEIEAVERQDFGDLVAVGLNSPAAGGATYSHDACLWACFYGRRASKTVLGQAEMSSYRDHNVIWTLGR